MIGYPYDWIDSTLEVFAPVPSPEGGHLMFAHHCTVCDQRRLVFPSQVTGLDNHAEGISVHFTCWCGAEQTQLTGAAARRGAKVLTAA